MGTEEATDDQLSANRSQKRIKKKNI